MSQDLCNDLISLLYIDDSIDINDAHRSYNNSYLENLLYFDFIPPLSVLLADYKPSSFFKCLTREIKMNEKRIEKLKRVKLQLINESYVDINKFILNFKKHEKRKVNYQIAYM